MRPRSRLARILSVAAVSLGLAVAAIIHAKVGWGRAGRILRGAVVGPRARVLVSRPFERTPARLERGRYLAEGLLRCFDCHSERDWKAPGAPPRPGMAGAGAAAVEEGAPFPIFSPNISPDIETGAGGWTDDMLARALREGIGHDGRALFPAMPYRDYKALSDEDTASIVVYLRSVPPVRNVVPRTALPFPFRYILNSIPEPLERPIAAPSTSDPVARGRYLADLAGCGACHDGRTGKGEPLPYGGGFVAKGPWGAVAIVNLTPHASGIAHYDDALFKHTLRTGRVGGVRALSPYMPWTFYRHLDDDDLQAIFAFLKSLPPVAHRVSNTDPPSSCRVCGNRHGLGDQN